MKYDQFVKVVAWLYVISGAGILILPFLTTGRANILGIESPYTYPFAVTSAIGLGLFGWRYFKNESVSYERETRHFNYQYPIIVAAISLGIFFVGGDFFVQAYNDSGKQGWLSVAVSGKARKLAVWWGPFVYCSCLVAAGYFMMELNKIIDKNIKEEVESDTNQD